MKAAAPRTSSARPGASPPSSGCQPRTKATAADHQDLEEQHGQDGQDLACDQSGAAQGSGGQEAQHSVAAVEAGGDALAGEGGGHGAQGQDAGHGNVDPAATEPVQQRRDGQADQGQQRQDDGEDQLLAVPEHRQRFVFALQQDAAQQRGGRLALRRATGRLSSDLPSRNVQEDVFEAAGLQAQRAGHDPVRGPPCGQRRQVLGRQRSGGGVAAGPRLA